MIITNCPKCGSMNITTAGVCANCGWSQFAQVTTESTRITGEMEIMLSGKALLDDYKRLLLENRNLKERVAELEAERDDWRKSYINLWRHINNLPQPPEVQE
jgi:predicted nucleic-acid-binding Zn-ribbon protein